ncbi:MAG: PEP/pyruvate-binding domain-containing protein [Candidatus Micrarchaeales archaeon]
MVIQKESDFVKSLNEHCELKEVGGKAFCLMELKREGFNVADGVVITTPAHEQWLKNKVVPSSLREELKSFTFSFPLIVRSSATAEDSKKASFAGRFTSCPNANSVEDVLGNLEKIYKDAGGENVISYCKRMDVDYQKVRMGVLVQEQLQPLYSGVVFTRNPLSGKDEVATDYTSGVPWELCERGANSKHIILTDSGLFAGLYPIVQKIEAIFGEPQDIEWALDSSGRYWILQARPITTLPQ